MPDKKISDFEIFDAIPDHNTAFVASSGNPALASATNVRFPFPTLTESIMEYVGDGYQIVSGNSSHAHFGAIDPNDTRDTFFYAQGTKRAELESGSFNIYPDLLCEKDISSIGSIHSSMGIFAPSGIFEERLGVGTDSPSMPLTVHSDTSSSSILVSTDAAAPSLVRLKNAKRTWELYNNSVHDFLGIYDRTNELYRLAINANGDIGIGTFSPSSRLDINGGDETLKCKHGQFGETLTVQGNDVITGLVEVYDEITLATGESLARDVSLKHEITDFSTQLYNTGQLLLEEKPLIRAVNGIISNDLQVGNSLTVNSKRVLTVDDLYSPATSSTLGLVKVDGGGIKIDSNGLLSLDNVTTPSFWTSDQRLKENIKSIPNALNSVINMNGVNFTWKENGYNSLSGQPDLGLIAQDLQKIIPLAVSEQQDGMMGIHYHRLFPILIEAIKELSSKVSSLEAQIKK